MKLHHLIYILSMNYFQIGLSIFTIDFWEHTIHTNNKNDFYIRLHCQTSEKFEFCEIGNMTHTGFANTGTCKFSKSTNNQTQFIGLIKDKCSNDNFLSKISYDAINQSDFDCKLNIENFEITGSMICKLL